MLGEPEADFALKSKKKRERINRLWSSPETKGKLRTEALLYKIGKLLIKAF